MTIKILLSKIKCIMKKEMIEKIREKVILANNPECENYNEALMHDIRSNKQECEVLLAEANQIIKWYDISKTSTFKYELIGQSLTLERVLVALNYYSEDSKINDLMTQDWGNMPGSAFGVIYRFGSEVFTIFWGRVEIYGFVEGNSEYNEEKTIDWQPNITLENQTDETIKAIYNILCV